MATNVRAQYGWPYLFGERTAADAMFATGMTRFVDLRLELDPKSSGMVSLFLSMGRVQHDLGCARHEVEERRARFDFRALALEWVFYAV